MDEYSQPLKIGKRELFILYYLRPRRKMAGRELIVANDKRFPFHPGFENQYTYVVKFFQKGNCAGNHYHLHKEEIMLPLDGKFEIQVEDTKTKKQDRFLIDSKDNVAFRVACGISHAVRSLDNTGILLVTSTTPSQESDDFYYPIEILTSTK